LLAQWTIKNFSQMRDGREYSPRFEVGTYEWRVLVIPKGTNMDGRFMSVFLDCPDAAWTPAHMNPKADFKLILHNQDPAKDVQKGEGRPASSRGSTSGSRPCRQHAWLGGRGYGGITIGSRGATPTSCSSKQPAGQ
jgi:hypothetical protein